MLVVNSVYPDNFAFFKACTSVCFTPQSSFALSSFQGFTSLRHLAINFISLRELNVVFASQFTSKSLSMLTHLETLCLKGYDLEYLEYPPSIQTLSLEDCPFLTSLPTGLQKICLHTCPKILDFSSLHNVTEASLNCPNVMSQEYLKLKSIQRLQVRGSITDKELLALNTLILIDVRFCPLVTKPPDLPLLKSVIRD
jgi:hypothetical protein